MIASDAVILGAAAVVLVIGVAGAAFVLRWEIRYQRRQRRHGGFIVGGRS